MERLRAGAADVGVTEVGEARAERFAGRAGAVVDERERRSVWWLVDSKCLTVHWVVCVGRRAERLIAW